jgi:biopolymer transport protein ExbB
MINKLANRTARITTAVITTALLTAPALLAQEAGKAAPVKRSMLQAWVLDGGWTMLFIGAAIIGFIALTIYNFMTLTKAKFCPTDLKMALMDHMANCRVRSAIELAASHPSYLGRI